MEGPDLKSKAILVVDDSPSVRQQVGLVLKQSGYECIEARDGFQALDLLRKHNVAMIICDVNMPGINGLALVDRLRLSERGIPCLMLSAEGNPKLQERARRAGATGWIIKPFNAERLIEAVKKLIGD